MFGFKHGRLGSAGTRTLIQRAIASLRARGSDAHLWLPGGDVKTYGAELVTNGGPFVDTTGWGATSTTLSIVSDSFQIDVANGLAHYLVSTVSGARYSMTFTAPVAGSSYVHVGTTASPKSLVDTGIPSAGTHTYTFIATAATTQLRFQTTATAGLRVSFVSLKEITSITPTITSGLTTGNYLESTGNTLATVDNPTGLVLDALGTVGVELFVADSVLVGVGWSKDGSTFTTTGVTGTCQLPSRLTAGKTYKYSATITGGSLYLFLGSSSYVGPVTGEYSWIGVSSASEQIMFQNNSAGVKTISNISVREVSGIHLTQSTTANKGLLKQDAGSRYYWLFDATDLLTGTFPAGYESVTVIDAKSTGQVTTSAANVVGSYSIGPSYSSYGRIIIKGSITASELALYQGFANRLAGL